MPKIIFSDIDGTLCHYNVKKYASVGEKDEGTGLWPCASLDGRASARLLKLPPSTSGAQAVISEATLQLCAALRALGTKLVLISGARASTLLQRLPFLPAADAYICEGGGLIFYPGSPLPTAAPLSEDAGWRAVHTPVAGPPGQGGLPPEGRQGLLWGEYARLKTQGLTVDAVSYTTAFRVRGAPDELAAVAAALPPGLSCSLNLGSLDIYPASSGKRAAAEHLMRKWGASPADCGLVCDDDNDLPLARLVAAAYVPGFTADSVEAAAAAEPHRFYISEARSVFGTEEILRHLVEQAAGGRAAATDGAATTADGR